jgi:hypothetical protein
LENFVRSAARLPKLDKDQVEIRRKMQMRSDATAFADANTAYVQSEQASEMAESGQLPLPGMEGMDSQGKPQQEKGAP